MIENVNLPSADNQIKPLGLRNDILIQELENELLLYDLSREKAFCLNKTALIIWNLCDGKNTIEDIRRQITVKLKTPISEEIIWLALDKLKQEQLLSNYQDITIKFNGLSRRDVIRKAALSTVIALPFISAIVAPKAAAAQSRACPSSTSCFCADASCINLGDIALLQSPCINTTCSGTGGEFCRCVGRFICGVTAGTRIGRCGLV